MKSLEELIEDRYKIITELNKEEISLESFKVLLQEVDDKMSKLVKRERLISKLQVKRDMLNKVYQTLNKSWPRFKIVQAEMMHLNNQLNCVKERLVVIHVHNPSELELIKEADLVHADYSFDIVPLHSYLLDNTTLQILVDEYHETMSNLKQY